MKTYNIAVIPGDGIGLEIVPAGLKVLNAVASHHAFGLAPENFAIRKGFAEAVMDNLEESVWCLALSI